MLTPLGKKSIQPPSSGRRRTKSAIDTSLSLSSRSCFQYSPTVILITVGTVLGIIITTAHAAADCGGGERFGMMRRLHNIPPTIIKKLSSSLMPSSSAAATLRFGNNRRGSILSKTSRRRTFHFENNGGTVAFLSSIPSIATAEGKIDRRKKYHDNHQKIRYNNFFSSTATVHNNNPPTPSSTAVFVSVSTAGEKEAKKKQKKSSIKPKAKSDSFNRHPATIYDYTSIHDPPITSSSKNLEIKSKPKQGGNWNPNSPLEWCKTFGSRSKSMQEHLSSIIQLKPGDEGYIPPEVYNDQERCAGVTIVRTREQAQIVLRALRESKLNEPERIHACDTEVMDIDLANVGPVGNGYVTCLSVYSGPDFDYGLDNVGPGSMLWVDNLDDACGVLEEFREWLEDETVMKIWHNYGFDRHVLWNEGIDVLGFGGDTSECLDLMMGIVFVLDDDVVEILL